jgi:hypothetical protein
MGIAATTLSDSTDSRPCGRLPPSGPLARVDRAGLALSLAEFALALDDLGRPEDAIRELDRAVATLTGIDRDRARVQRAIILRRLGRDEEALASYRVALAGFRRAGDRLWQARTLTNRGVLQAYRGDVRAAERDLRRAESLYAELGDRAAVAQVRHNLGFVAARAGDIPKAMHWYDRADEDFRRHGRPAQALIDRADLLLEAQLWAEAYHVAAAAARAATRHRLLSLLPQARLLQARAALATGDAAGARAAAAAARAAFRRQGRAHWTALADYVLWRADTNPAASDTAWFAEAGELARRLAEAGWTEAALETQILAAEAAIDLTNGSAAGFPGDDGFPNHEDFPNHEHFPNHEVFPNDDGPNDGGIPDDAGSGRDAGGAGGPAARAAVADLARTVSAIPRASMRVRARAWYGRALTRLFAGDRVGAKRALSSAMRLLDAYRDTLGSAELRANVSAEGTRPATLGLRLALHDRDAMGVLTWAERHRLAALRLARRPPPAVELAQRLAQLRHVHAEISTVDGDSVRLAGLRRRQRHIEAAVRRLTWRTPAVTSDLRRPVTAIRAGLAGRTLVEFVQVDGALGAVVITDDRARLRDLGRVAEIAAEANALRFALRRLALRAGTARSLAAARTAAAHAARRLDALILAPLRRLIGDAPLVLVPTGVLFGLPWPMLATCRGRTLDVAPSASLWCAASEYGAAPGPSESLVLVAAQAPPHAVTEVERVAQTRPDAVVLAGARARVPTVVAALDGAGVAHLAAHGQFRADNPLFSQVCLADGPLTGYDLLYLRQPPGLLVVSACETGRASVRDGDELMGFTSAMLGLGTRAVVASVGPVDDEATAALMVDLHRRLHAGATPAAALAQAQVATADDPYDSTYSFVCFGAG